MLKRVTKDIVDCLFLVELESSVIAFGMRNIKSLSLSGQVACVHRRPHSYERLRFPLLLVSLLLLRIVCIQACFGSSCISDFFDHPAGVYFLLLPYTVNNSSMAH